MKGMYWEEWDVGAEFESPARTVTGMRMLTLLRQPGANTRSACDHRRRRVFVGHRPL